MGQAEIKTITILGKKCGMTRVFDEAGKSLPVTVVEAKPNTIMQLKSEQSDGYSAVQISYGEHPRPKNLSKSRVGYYKKAGVAPGLGLSEFRVQPDELDQFKVGDKISVAIFKEGQRVDVVSKSKGKGFSGTVKRWNFRTQDASHGNSLSHRAPGSIGQCQTPGRVFKGKKMAGQYGNEKVTALSQLVVKVDQERHLILIQGAVPGPTGSTVMVRHAVKH